MALPWSPLFRAVDRQSRRAKISRHHQRLPLVKRASINSRTRRNLVYIAYSGEIEVMSAPKLIVKYYAPGVLVSIYINNVYSILTGL